MDSIVYHIFIYASNLNYILYVVKTYRTAIPLYSPVNIDNLDSAAARRAAAAHSLIRMFTHF